MGGQAATQVAETQEGRATETSRLGRNERFPRLQFLWDSLLRCTHQEPVQDDESLPSLTPQRCSSDESDTSAELSVCNSSTLAKIEADVRGQEVQDVAHFLSGLGLPDIGIEKILEFAAYNIEEQVATSNMLYRGRDNDNTSYLIGKLDIRGRPRMNFFELVGLYIKVSSRGVGPQQEQNGLGLNLCTKVDLELHGQNGRGDKPRSKLFQHVNTGRKWERTECDFEEDSPEIHWLQQELDQSGTASIDLIAVSIPGWKCKIRSAVIHAIWKPRALAILYPKAVQEKAKGQDSIKTS